MSAVSFLLLIKDVSFVIIMSEGFIFWYIFYIKTNVGSFYHFES